MSKVKIIVICIIAAVIAAAGISQGFAEKGDVIKHLPIFTKDKEKNIWSTESLRNDLRIRIPSHAVPKIDGAGQKEISKYLDAPFFGVSFPDDKKMFTVNNAVSPYFMSFDIKKTSSPAIVSLSMVSAPELRSLDMGSEAEYKALIDKINKLDVYIEGESYKRKPASGYPGQYENGGDYIIRTVEDPYFSNLGMSPDTNLTQRDIFLRIGDIPVGFSYFVTPSGGEDRIVQEFINSIKPMPEGYIEKAVSYGGILYPGEYSASDGQSDLSNPALGLFSGVNLSFVNIDKHEDYINEANAVERLGIDAKSSFIFTDDGGNLRVQTKSVSFIIIYNPDDNIQTVITYPSYQEKYAENLIIQ